MRLETQRSLLVTFHIALAVAVIFAAVAKSATMGEISRPPCSDCHLCANPTMDNPCLKSCMRSSHRTVSTHKPTEGPGLIVLGTRGNLYEPVRFDHSIHANMGDMNGGCSNCHHYSPKGKFPPCRDCHSQPQTMGQPGLKGAYHRQCMGCHRDWSHSTACANCHAPLGSVSSGLSQAGARMSDIDQHTIIKPAKRVYHTPYTEGATVTFYHNEHVDLFGLECTSCHQRESCGYCHDRAATTAAKKTEEEIHAICNDCHQGDSCDKCHGDKEKPPFQHDPAHWRLGEYHRQLDCASCHPTGKRISQMNADCNSCHEGWDSENFVHAVTGLKLDENHVDLDCGDCHVDRRFHDIPDCTGCHDDDRAAKTNPPGTRLNLTASSGFTNDAKEVF